MWLFRNTFCFSCLHVAALTFVFVLCTMRRYLSAAEVARAIGLPQAGQTQRQVAGQLNISQSAISRLWNRFQQTGNVSERLRSG